MSDPVAEAAAQIAEQAAQTQEDVAALGNAPAVAEASVTAPATAEEVGTPAVGEPQTADTSPSAPAMVAEAPTSTADSDAPQQAAELPNVASGAAEPTTAPDSASSAAGADTTKSTAASSGEDPNAGGTTATATVDSAVISTPTLNSASQLDGVPKTSAEEPVSIAAIAEPPLHIRIAEHLEAIYTLARDSAVSNETAATRAAAATKTHIGDVLHRISNGMQVTEGELVQKLEALYRML